MPTANRAGDSTHEEAGRHLVPAEGVTAATAAWRPPASLVIIAVTAVGLVLRVLLLTRPGFLTSGTVEYDDGVYLGAAIRLLQGALPYRDFAYVQPPASWSSRCPSPSWPRRSPRPPGWPPSGPSSPLAADIIPADACVVTDQVSFTIAADRFTLAPGCPDVLDSLAETLTLSGGVSVPGGAGREPRVTAGWEAVFGRARYVWLTQGYQARIPWTARLQSWFTAHFRLVRTFRDYGQSHLYERR